MPDDPSFIPWDATIIGTFDVRVMLLHDSIPPFKGKESLVLSNYGTVTFATEVD